MNQISNVSILRTLFSVARRPRVALAGCRCVYLAIRYFFLPQFHARIFKGRIPVSSVDHPLDEKIPFIPQKVSIYLDFIFFWIRMVGSLLQHYGKASIEVVSDYVDSMGKLYTHAYEVYRKNLSTTRRPLYLKHPRFVLIQALDPHLMCIPSLHVMDVIRCYTIFRKILKDFGDEKILAARIEELFQGAIAISESVLFVKQHSVNCIAAAMYAMTRFDPDLFPPSEAQFFVNALFQEVPEIPGSQGDLIREYIHTLYLRFIQEGEGSETWEQPLLDFLSAAASVLN